MPFALSFSCKNTASTYEMFTKHPSPVAHKRYNTTDVKMPILISILQSLYGEQKWATIQQQQPQQLMLVYVN